MQPIRTLLPAVALASLATLAQAGSFTENFSTLTITKRFDASGALACSAYMPANTVSFVPAGWSTPDTWNFFATSSYPVAWSGTNATQAWAVSGNQMYFHARHTANDDGHAILTGQTFDRGSYILAKGTMRAYCEAGQAGCMAGITLIVGESSYRALYMRTNGMGSAQVLRLAPCNEQQTSTFVPINTDHQFALEYRGPEGGGWSYYLDGNRIDAMYGVNGAPNYVAGGVEMPGGSNTDATLTGDPRLGFYTVGAAVPNNPPTLPPTYYYAEGAIQSVSVVTLAKAVPVAVTVSSNSGSAGSATDGNNGTAWVSATGGAGWIQLDLGSSKAVRKLRLLTEQTPAGSTVHDVYIGDSPGSMALVRSFSGYTTANQWLDATFIDSPRVGRYVKVYTGTTPSWVAWREVQVFTE